MWLYWWIVNPERIRSKEWPGLELTRKELLQRKLRRVKRRLMESSIFRIALVIAILVGLVQLVRTYSRQIEQAMEMTVVVIGGFTCIAIGFVLLWRLGRLLVFLVTSPYYAKKWRRESPELKDRVHELERQVEHITKCQREQKARFQVLLTQEVVDQILTRKALRMHIAFEEQKLLQKQFAEKGDFQTMRNLTDANETASLHKREFWGAREAAHALGFKVLEEYRGYIPPSILKKSEPAKAMPA